VNRFGRLYIGIVAAIGAVGLAYSVYAVPRMPFDPRYAIPYIPFDYRIILLAVLTWVSGSFAIRVPGLPATIYVSEAFFFTLVLLFGPYPAAVCMAIDGLLISKRRKHHEPYRVLFNFAEPVISVLVASAAFYKLYGGPPLSIAPAANIGAIALPAVALASVYFLLNSGLNAVAVSSESDISAFRLWRTQFVWLSLNYFGGASVAVLLAIYWPNLSPAALVVVGPLVVIFWISFKTTMARAEDSNKHLTELNKLYLSTVETLAMAIDAKDQITHGHIRRVQTYAVGLAKALCVNDTKVIRAIEAAALLHDMGKLAVPEHILNKPGKLTASEYERMKLHAPVGAQILSAIDFPYPVVPIVRHHHENFDGTGYPDRLRGEDIPLGARIMAVVDCYDALTSDRPYRPALCDEEALAIVEARKGTMYDPAVTDAFVKVHAEIAAEVNEHEHDVSAFRELLHQSPTAAAVVEHTGSGSKEMSAALLALSDLAAEIAGHTAVEDMAVALGSRIRQTVPCDLAVFYLRDRVSDDLVAVHALGAGSEALKGLRLRMGEGLSGWVALNRTTIMNSSGALDLAERRQALPALLDSALATPLCACDTVVGVLTLYAASREAFTSEQQQVVEFAARQIGPALERALAFEQERTASLFDAETGLPNEKYLDRVLNSAIYCCQGDGPKPGVLLLSGAALTAPAAGPGGDAAAAGSPSRMVRLATTCRSVVRVTDLVFRTGDDEVAVLMTDSTPDAMAAVARRVTEAMHDETRERGDTSIESAFALFPDHVADPADLPRAARARRAQLRLVPQARPA
jgi:putative nucleotidyltransferase with HDIG domain